VKEITLGIFRRRCCGANWNVVVARLVLTLGAVPTAARFSNGGDRV
jgi:hypothetical protein